ncbi:MAG: F0F1 ATP synthase subunit A [Phycisphaerae bacterium]
MTGLLAAADPLEHVYQWTYLKSGEGMLWGFTWISNHTIMQIIAALLLILLVPRFVKLRDSGDTVKDLTPRGFGNFIEAICSYLRKEVAQPVLGEYTDRFIPFVWSAFFYVLTVNLLGLLPLEPLTRGITRGLFDAHHGFGGSATGNIWVTGTLAVVTLGMIVVNGLRLGGMHYIGHFCPGPLWLAPLLVPVEIIGLGAKIFALTVRLFANMVAGHVLLAVLAGFIVVAYQGYGWLGGAGVGIIVVLASIAFNMLEIFVAFLQAFIFTFLTTLFIGQAIVFQHNGHQEGAH